jgi:hypothetical protein
LIKEKKIKIQIHYTSQQQITIEKKINFTQLTLFFLFTFQLKFLIINIKKKIMATHIYQTKAEGALNRANGKFY